MLFTISTTHAPATDLGYLLHKSPFAEAPYEVALSYGRGHVFFPEANESRCTAALFVELDPIALVRGRGPDGEGAPLAQYVNDRPYVASSFLAVAIGRAFGSAMGGRSRERQTLADTAIPLEAKISSVRVPSESMVRAFFEPLGYKVALTLAKVDETFPEWGLARTATLTLRGSMRVRDLLAHVTVMIPALDGETHYWVGDDEIDKLLRRGEGWLASHPARETITARYLRHQKRLARVAMSRLNEGVAEESDETDRDEDAIEKPMRLSERRVDAVLEVVRDAGMRSLVDLGCGGGGFVRAALKEKQLERIVGVEVSSRALEVAETRMQKKSEAERARVSLLLGSVLYRDARLDGIDVATCIEVIEHLDADRLPFFVANVFGAMRPKLVVITTPNAEANAKMPGLAPGAFRHRDHRFEWTRAELIAFATDVARKHAYDVRFLGIGDDDVIVGAPTQMAIFTRRDGAS